MLLIEYVGHIGLRSLTDGHLGSHLEYFKLLNDARVASLGFIKYDAPRTRINKEKNFKIKFHVILVSYRITALGRTDAYFLYAFLNDYILFSSVIITNDESFSWLMRGINVFIPFCLLVSARVNKWVSVIKTHRLIQWYILPYRLPPQQILWTISLKNGGLSVCCTREGLR